jgi:hypothetical protein
MSRRRWLLLAAAVLVVVVLSAPLWLGYFGPEPGAYATVWRPWRSDITVQLDQPADSDETQVSLTAQYRDPWPGQAHNPGWQVRVVRMSRPIPLLPWVVTGTGTGP